MPQLVAFSAETDFNHDLYSECVDIAWLDVMQQTHRSNYKDLATECLARSPDTEEFDHPMASAALNACLITATAMRFFDGHETECIIDGAALAIDAAAMSAQRSNAHHPRSLSSAELKRDPLVRRELAQQISDLQYVADLPTEPIEAFVASVKARARGD